VTEIGSGFLKMQFSSVDLNYSVYNREVQFSKLKSEQLLRPSSIYRAKIVSTNEIKFDTILPTYFKSTWGQQRMICMNIG